MTLFPNTPESQPVPREPELVAPPKPDESPSLLTADASPSPMEEWRERHKVMVYPTQEGFRACGQLRKAHGKTREEALLAWAERSNVPCWKAEAVAKKQTPTSDTARA